MISTLLLTGTNNHDWRRSSPFLAQLLEHSGDFQVQIAENASHALEEVGDQIPQLFVLDYNGPLWSDAARETFVRCVQAGAGVVIVHAADNCFEGWTDYERMCGLVFRQKNGHASGHGDFHSFAVKIRDHTHPITRDLADFTTEDELYHRMVHVPDAQFEILATASSDNARGGTGLDEPVLLTSNCGEGRVFHTLLGHLWKGDPDGEYRGASLVALENPGFQATFLRGCQWAARVLN